MIKKTPIVCIAGKSESGKTTLIEKLIPELKKRGYSIGSIKHSCQRFDIDKKGKDSWRHRKAGADIVVIASKDKIAMIKDNDCESLDCLKKYFNGVDLVIAEGFNKENIPKIEIVRAASGKKPLCLDDSKLIAVVTDSDTGHKVPKFGLEEIDKLADFIERKYFDRALMTRDDLNYLKTWFTEYVSNFYSDDPDCNYSIRLKEEHTIRVCRNIAMLGKELGLSDQDMVLAETIALFHDIGRFKQYAKYHTFNDFVSENHARLGLRQMAIHGVLSLCTTAEKRLITRAIAYHNAAVLPANEDDNTLFFIRLIRDADKLDIWKLLIDYYNEREKNHSSAVELGLPDEPIYSQRVIESLKQRRLVLMQDLKTLNDFKLLQISWVFDLNFVPSFQTVQSRKYIEKLEETLPKSKEIKEAVQQAHDHVNSFL